jgi:hypothetical protein
VDVGSHVSIVRLHSDAGIFPPTVGGPCGGGGDGGGEQREEEAVGDVPVITAFKRIHPQVQFDYFYGLPAEQLKALHAGRLDLAFLYLPVPLDGLEHQVIWRMPFKVVLPQRHPLSRRPALELGDLRCEDFAFCTRESRPEFYDEFFRLCANAGFRPRVVKEVGGYPTNMLGLISVGLGVSVLPHFEKIERISGIVWRTLSKPRLWWDRALVWRRQGASRVVEQFVPRPKNNFRSRRSPTALSSDYRFDLASAIIYLFLAVGLRIQSAHARNCGFC